MKRILLSASVLVSALSLQAQEKEVVPSIVSAERQFAASALHGVKEAFLAVLDEEGILFRPKPVNGKEATEKGPASPGLLTWYPEYAEIAASGEMGYTTGPFEFKMSATDPKSAHGHYVSIWRKNAQGIWKLLLDVGVNHPQVTPAPALHFTKAADPVKPFRKPVDKANAGNQLLLLEKTFAKNTSEQGLEAAYTAFLAPDARFYRTNQVPVLGKNQILEKLPKTKEVVIFTPAYGEVALSGDFGYTYGVGSQKSGEHTSAFSYARFWRRQPNGDWRIILDIINPFPPAKA
ncbi:MAG: YybH family protein [Rufibacter sp.]